MARDTYTEAERKRARRYRDHAKKCRANAAKTKDLEARPGLIQFAQLCDMLADSIEAKLPNDDLSIANLRI
jgi:hypothetical protein